MEAGSGLVAKSCLTLATPLIVVCQAALSMGFSKQEYWSGLPCPLPGLLHWQVDSLPSEPREKPRSSQSKSDIGADEAPLVWFRAAQVQIFSV